MEFRQLDALRLVLELGSFSDAAKQLGVTQPSVSTQISALEKEFGCELVVRRPGRAVPSETGRSLYSYALEILALRDKAVANCGRHKEMGGDINVAASSIPYQFVLPVLTAEFSMKYPDVHFNLTGGDSASTERAVLQGSADLGLVGTLPESDELVATPLLEDELVLVTPDSEPYSGWPAEAVPVEYLQQVPFVAREPGSGTWAEVQNYLEQQGYESGALRVVAQMDNPDAIAKAVEQGMGATILSRLAANDYARKGNIRIFPLEGNRMRRKIYLICRKNAIQSPVLAAFARFTARRQEGER